MTDVTPDRTASRRPVRRALASLAAGLLALPLGWAAVTGAPAAADDGVTVDTVTVTSSKAEAWATIDLTASWHATNPEAGQTFVVELGDGLRWPAGLSFSLVDKDRPEVAVGDCVASAADAPLTCTLNSEVDQWDRLDGTLTARAQITGDLIGATSTTMTVGGTPVTVVPGDSDGDGVCDTTCDGVLPEQAEPVTRKSGWLQEVTDSGTFVWRWDVNVSGSTQYTVVDSGPTFSSLRCTDTDWSEARPVQPTLDINTGALTWTVDSVDTVCRVRFTSTSTSGTAQNVATVNGVDYTATAQATALGSGDVTGATTPLPSASATTSANPSMTDVPTGTATDVPTGTATDVPTGTATDVPTGTATDVPTGTATDVPTGTATDVPTDRASVTTTTTTTTRNPQLARTGSAAGTVALVAIVLTAAGGAGLYIVRRRA
ncbi:hypothetical protein [Actinomyces howellii]|uniref:SDR-like Ig domain-containing protein n=1 Tax=Actinomyces howellii TaxID=52771 RepID=A0A448HFY6_9ACTO|nr:hypothetical protein [Actinomyces howellii]VEG27554.1 Uncharacterised protein [Actinomyces howellii]